MSSFQQVVMGGICLVAAFWFGSYINEQPADPNMARGPLQQLPDGTLAPTNTPQRQTLTQKTHGFLAALFDKPAVEKTQTLEQLKARSLARNPMNPALAQNPNDPNSPFVHQQAEATDALAQTRFPIAANTDHNTGSTTRVSPPVQTAEAVPRLAIVPDFSSLAQELKRDTSQPVVSRTNITETAARLLPVPGIDEFKHDPSAQPHRDWNAVKQQVMSVEDKLAQFRQSNPVPEVVPTALTNVRTLPAAMPSPDAMTSPNAVFEAEPDTRRNINFDPQPEIAARPRNEMYIANDLRTQPLVAQPRVEQPRFEQSHYEQPLRQPAETLADRQTRWRVFDNRSERPAEMPNTLREVPAETQSQLRPTVASQPIEFIPARRIDEGSRVHSFNAAIGDELAMDVYDDYNADRQSGWIRAGESPRRPQERSVLQQRTANQRDNVYVEEARSPVNAEVEMVSPPEPIVRYERFEEYVTRANDTLQLISQDFYGTPDYYFDLYLANRPMLTNPATVPVGVTLKIPKFDN